MSERYGSVLGVIWVQKDPWEWVCSGYQVGRKGYERLLERYVSCVSGTDETARPQDGKVSHVVVCSLIIAKDTADV
jgi:photosystem II stability/assembly factor-like uncharacterized protein